MSLLSVEVAGGAAREQALLVDEILGGRARRPARDVVIGEAPAVDARVPGSDVVAACDAILPAMVERDPEWAGWCGVLVNVNDLAAMGAAPVALLDAVGARDASFAHRVLLVEELGFAWEVDSVEHHFATPDQVDDTVRRQRALRGVGLHVMSTRPSQRRDDPDGTLRDVLDGLAVAAALPPPRATFVDAVPRLD